MELKDEVNPGVKRVTWIAQRTVWALMATFIALAVIGVFGSGFISRDTVRASAGGADVEVAYNRWGRASAPHALEISVEAPGASGDTLRVVVSEAFLDAARIDSISPDPDSSGLGPDGQELEWQVSDWSEPVRVRIDYEPKQWPRLSAAVLVTAGEGEEQRLKFAQVLFP